MRNLNNIKTLIKKRKRNIVVLGLLAAFFFILFYIFYNLPNPYKLRDFQATPLSTQIFDRNGKLLYDIYKEQNRTPVKLKDLPKYITEATIAIEDKDFYRHQGVSLLGGILRAIKDTFLTTRVQGGSTITQQLIKTSLLSPERTIRRKIREIILALFTEKIYTKDEILEMYLNQVPYGGAAYGIEQASLLYFDKSAKKLSLAEAAFLAGLPQAPSLYSPYLNPELSLNRKNTVLDQMYKQKYIDKKTYEKTKPEKLDIKPPKNIIKAPHFVFYVKKILEEKYGKETVEEGGLKVTTTLDLDIQERAEKILKEELEKVKNLDVSNGAVLVTRPPTGEILAMIGSADYFASGSGAFNVTTALRQPGSSIKPINYAIGLERKLVTPATVFIDSPTCFTGGGQPQAYCPINYDGKFHGPTALRFALGNSYNIPAVKMLAFNGVKEFVASSSAFGITTFKDPKNYGLSLTLGGGEVRMTEMAQAFSSFANRGKVKKLTEILKIEDKLGKTLYKFENSNFIQDVKKPMTAPSSLSITGQKAISPETSFLISHILLDNNARSAAFGESSYLNVPGHAVSVKTGTTDDKRDNWTIGYTPNFLTAVWVGNNDNTPMNPYLTSGVTGAAPIWNHVMTSVLKNQPDLWLIRPDTVVGKQVCWDSGDLAVKGDDGKENCSSRFEYFIKGTEPKESHIQKATVPVTKDDKLAPANWPEVEMKEKTIIKDMFGMYCVDCSHNKEPSQNIRL
ncbi:penicillin-binding protein [Candidatus Roizmanbacteria bacterium CG03_land_8_20_14_0_80_35_26]|uniref:Penicillin-binding protein n=3 Tax=Candidatus Roizmaniibacteriota TaxID=1752723 RepID=A0A2M7BXD4_9BACT|nr:MAG: penicillin-binding protein [Candidatus Roizmanbacteria bacterium CG11_big_fil_rev_8_21_14_0_20_35_14]PIV11199.1 MAG: penicillin-binding protein [Candidatus Roizmanbacteria bacterium CG03_land_8_20_14_0_80_35_26]PJC30734.1 MAG: penicillin-binding protein [Candidatus Roizmanbacteria bacterium CG_4_9_14_0_2_um_filter_36_12]PJC80289.1 MAG: penicillin-binding protein [Candidatus Roizmanbacteria bacterium CG_4_8_14_3_um_filter_36_12]